MGRPVRLWYPDAVYHVMARSGGMTGDVLRGQGDNPAERIVRRPFKFLRLTPTTEALATLPNGDHRKAALAWFLRERTSVSNDWIAASQSMEYPGSVSQIFGAYGM